VNDENVDMDLDVDIEKRPRGMKKMAVPKNLILVMW
jgi:hypothetical protein